MIACCIIAWVLLTACGEYLLRQASFLDGWRGRRCRAAGWWSRMLGCFNCPWGWSAIPAALVVCAGVLGYYWCPWLLVPLGAVCVPLLGLGLSRIVAYLSPLAAQQPQKG